MTETTESDDTLELESELIVGELPMEEAREVGSTSTTSSVCTTNGDSVDPCTDSEVDNESTDTTNEGFDDSYRDSEWEVESTDNVILLGEEYLSKESSGTVVA